MRSTQQSVASYETLRCDLLSFPYNSTERSHGIDAVFRIGSLNIEIRSTVVPPRFQGRLEFRYSDIPYPTTQRSHFFAVVCRKLLRTRRSRCASFEYQILRFQRKQ